MLGEVADTGIVALGAGAILGFDEAAEDFQQGGFTGAIGADEHGALAAFHFQS